MRWMILAGLCATVASAEEMWQHFTKSNGLPGDEIQFLRQDEAGAVWIGTLTGLSVFRGDKFASLQASGEFWDLLQIGPDKYWVGAGGGALLLDGAKQEWSLAGNTVAPILRYDAKTVWALSKNRGTEQNLLMATTGRDWQPVARFEKEKVVDLLHAQDGSVWVAVDGNGVFLVPVKDGPVTATQQLPGLNVTAMRQDSKGRVWCGLWGKGVAVWDKGIWTRHLTKETSVILGIREDTKGQIWVATSEHGLWRFADDQWTNDLAAEGSINMLETTSDGRVWISSQSVGGLRYWDGAKWQVSLANPLPIRCLLETKTKQIWAGAILDGLYRRP